MLRTWGPSWAGGPWKNEVVLGCAGASDILAVHSCDCFYTHKRSVTEEILSENTVSRVKLDKPLTINCSVEGF